jgi:hypothetical protein
MTAYEPPSSRRIVGAATCAMVESSRSMTAAVTTAPNATHRNFRPTEPAEPAEPVDPAFPAYTVRPVTSAASQAPVIPFLPVSEPPRCGIAVVIATAMSHCGGCPWIAAVISEAARRPESVVLRVSVDSGADDIG